MIFTILALLLLPPGSPATPTEQSGTRTTWAAILPPRQRRRRGLSPRTRGRYPATSAPRLPSSPRKGGPRGAMARPSGARLLGPQQRRYADYENDYDQQVASYGLGQRPGGHERVPNECGQRGHGMTRLGLFASIWGSTRETLRLKDNLRCAGAVHPAGWLRDSEGIEEARLANRDMVVDPAYGNPTVRLLFRKFAKALDDKTAKLFATEVFNRQITAALKKAKLKKYGMMQPEPNEGFVKMISVRKVKVGRKAPAKGRSTVTRQNQQETEPSGSDEDSEVEADCIIVRFTYTDDREDSPDVRERTGIHDAQSVDTAHAELRVQRGHRVALRADTARARGVVAKRLRVDLLLVLVRVAAAVGQVNVEARRLGGVQRPVRGRRDIVDAARSGDPVFDDANVDVHTLLVRLEVDVGRVERAGRAQPDVARRVLRVHLGEGDAVDVGLVRREV
ncbi:hypothetical protein DL762_006636 [Monosporascus cannonballus]|uniref:Uncharacterized protein n=1 Tax=Monosporascus cannonballus TaxID=155416 RepID=A0ABY0H4X7_9PEZI|nr:hypothetical protein DL762_006636 [Monosporascus cannonballus]